MTYPVSVMAISDSRVRNLVALCGSADKLKVLLDSSHQQNPGKPSEWHIVQLEQQLRPKSASTVASSTIAHLKQVMPGQAESWYGRIAQLIHDGLMEMPALEGHRPKVEWQVSGARSSEFNLEPLVIQPKAVQRKVEKPVSQAIQQELIRLCHGDRAMAERLAKYEQNRAPGASESVAWQRAIDSLLRDRQSLYSDGLYR